MFDKINFLIPTRGRSGGLLRQHMDSVELRCSNPNSICFSFLADEDDSETIKFLYSIDDLDINVHIQNSTPTPNLAEFYNLLFDSTPYKESSTLVGMIGDDMAWVTDSFDALILDAFNRESMPKIACCDDGYHHSHKRFVNMILPRYVVDATGHPFMCPSFPADYTDDMWWHISEGIGATMWLDDIVLYHDHASRRTASDRDETCRRLRAMVGTSRTNLTHMQPWIDSCIANLKENGVCACKK